MKPRELLPWAGSKKARDAWDEVFSRQTLGAVVLGSATGKIVETAIVLLFPRSKGRLVAWIFAAVVGVYVFVYWHRISAAAEEAAEDAAEDVTSDRESQR